MKELKEVLKNWWVGSGDRIELKRDWSVVQGLQPVKVPVKSASANFYRC